MTTPYSSCSAASSSNESLQGLDDAGVPPSCCAAGRVHDVDAGAELGGDGEVTAVHLDAARCAAGRAAAVLEVQERPVDREGQSCELDDAHVGLVQQAVTANGQDLGGGRDLPMRSRAAASEKFA